MRMWLSMPVWQKIMAVLFKGLKFGNNCCSQKETVVLHGLMTSQPYFTSIWGSALQENKEVIGKVSEYAWEHGSCGVLDQNNKGTCTEIINSQAEVISRETQWPNPKRPNLCWAPAFYVPENCHICVEGGYEGPRETECSKKTRLMIR